MDAKVLGEKIASLRKAQGLTQKQLAEVLHITDGAVSKWERGINYPDLSMLETIAAALKSDMITLLSLEESSKEQVARVIAEQSAAEKQELIRQLRFRSIYKIVIEILIAAAFIIASRIFADHGIYGASQRLTLGMSGFVGVLIGSDLFAIRNLPKLR